MQSFPWLHFVATGFLCRVGMACGPRTEHWPKSPGIPVVSLEIHACFSLQKFLVERKRERELTKKWGGSSPSNALYVEPVTMATDRKLLKAVSDQRDYKKMWLMERSSEPACFHYTLWYYHKKKYGTALKRPANTSHWQCNCSTNWLPFRLQFVCSPHSNEHFTRDGKRVLTLHANISGMHLLCWIHHWTSWSLTALQICRYKAIHTAGSKNLCAALHYAWGKRDRDPVRAVNFASSSPHSDRVRSWGLLSN
jgi:hypothetical protein